MSASSDTRASILITSPSLNTLSISGARISIDGGKFRSVIELKQEITESNTSIEESTLNLEYCYIITVVSECLPDFIAKMSPSRSSILFEKE